MAEATEISRKRLSCVARLDLLDQRRGVKHVVAVLRGANTEAIRTWRHDQLSTYGLLKDIAENVLTNLVFQLIDLGLIDRTGGEYPLLVLGKTAGGVLRGEAEVELVDPRVGGSAKPRAAEDSWEGVDRGLFERLRTLRSEIARERSVPAYVVFGDASLRSMARIRPSTPQTFRDVHGVGEKKLADLGPRFIAAIVTYCAENELELDQAESGSSGPAIVVPKNSRPNPQRDKAMTMFSVGASIDVVAGATERALSTVSGYLVQYIEMHKPRSVKPWVDEATYEIVATAMDEVGTEGLRPIFEHLDEQVPYETIRIVAAHLQARCDSES